MIAKITEVWMNSTEVQFAFTFVPVNLWKGKSDHHINDTSANSPQNADGLGRTNHTT